MRGLFGLARSCIYVYLKTGTTVGVVEHVIVLMSTRRRDGAKVYHLWHTDDTY